MGHSCGNFEIRVGCFFKLIQSCGCSMAGIMGAKDSKINPLLEKNLPVFQFEANLVHDLNYCGRRILTRTAVDGKISLN